MRKAPSIYKLQDLAQRVNDRECLSGTKDGKWVPARSLGYFSLAHRAKCAWMVFTGKADCVIWPNDQ